MKLHFSIFFVCSVAEACHSGMARGVARISGKMKSRFKPRRSFETVPFETVRKHKRWMGGTMTGGGLLYAGASEIGLSFEIGAILETIEEKIQEIQMLQSPEVCNDCFHEFEKIWEAVDETMDIFCEKRQIDLPELYDAKNKNCTAQGAVYYYRNRGAEIFENFGAENNKCLKAKSEYLAEMEKDSKCREGNDLIQGDFLRCIYDRAYQPEETEKSCIDY